VKILKKNKSGFTLIELLIVMVISAILAALAAPGYRDMVDRFRLRSAIESIQSDLIWAKSEAFRGNGSIVFSMTGEGSYTWGYSIGSLKTVSSQHISSDVVKLTTADAITFFPLSNVPSLSSMAANGITLTSKLEKSVVITTTPLGEVEVCSPDSKMLVYYNAC